MTTIGLHGNRMFDAHLFTAELQPIFIDVHHHNLAPANANEFNASQSNWPRANDQNGIIGFWIRSIGCVTSDRQRFHERQLFIGQCVVDVHFVSGHVDAFAHSAVGVDADDLHVVAAVRFSFAARIAFRVVHVGLDADAVSDSDVRDSGTKFDNFTAKLMAWNSRKLEERKLSQPGGRIGAANADSMDRNLNFAFSGSLRFVTFDHADCFFCIERDSLQRIASDLFCGGLEKKTLSFGRLI